MFINKLINLILFYQTRLDCAVVMISTILVVSLMWKFQKAAFCCMCIPPLWMIMKFILCVRFSGISVYTILFYAVNLFMFVGLYFVLSEKIPDFIYIPLIAELVFWVIAILLGLRGMRLNIFIEHSAYIVFYAVCLWSSHAMLNYMMFCYDKIEDDEIEEAAEEIK